MRSNTPIRAPTVATTIVIDTGRPVSLEDAFIMIGAVEVGPSLGLVEGSQVGMTEDGAPLGCKDIVG